MSIGLVTEYYNKFNDLADSFSFILKYFEILSIKYKNNRRFRPLIKTLIFPFNKLNCVQLINFH